VPDPIADSAARAGADPAQRRVVGALMVSQVLGGLGLSGGIAVGSLLAEDLLGSADLAGLANTAQILGAAALAVPMAQLMAARGRRVGLVSGYVVAAVGALLAVASSVVRSFSLLLIGAALFGAATTSNNQARYAAVDLAAPEHRGRDLSLVVWATTVGAVLGPNLLAPAAPLARMAGLAPLVGVWLVSVCGFLLAGGWLTWRLRPDPLVTARQRATRQGQRDHPTGAFRPALRMIARSRPAAVGALIVALGHTVMVSVMVMTPLHMTHGGAELRLVGLVISIHVLGMFAFAPVMGRLVDRHGERAVAVAGAGVLAVGCLVAAQAPDGWSAGLAAGLFLLGLGWCATLVSGSTLLTAATPPVQRPGVQGVSDLMMGACGAAGGALSGMVVGSWGYPRLAVLGAVVAVLLGWVAAVGATGRPGALGVSKH
jgi:MFS family permease